MEKLVIREVTPEEAGILTRISLQSKAYWNYPEEWCGIWLNELAITPQYIKDNAVHAVQHGEHLIGYYSLVSLQYDLEVAGEMLQRGYWLEHMFVLPQWIGKGCGRMMMHHLVELCRSRSIDRLSVLSDPNARAFYEKTGWVYLREFPSAIPSRTTPLLCLDVSPAMAV